MQGDGDNHRSNELGRHRRVQEGAEIGEHGPLIGDDLHGARDHQPAGGAEKSANHRKRHEADSAAGTGKAEDA